MSKFLFFILLIFIHQLALAGDIDKAKSATVTYAVEDTFPNQLVAHVNGKKQVVISSEDRLAIEKSQDFDNDGYSDILFLEYSGSCCPSDYRLALYRPKQSFVIHDLTDSWVSPIIKKHQDGWELLFLSDNEGINDDDYKASIRRYTLEKGKPTLKEEIHDEEIKAVVEIRSRMLTPQQQNSRETFDLLHYDLNGDEQKDTITGRYWDRWGRMMIGLAFTNGIQLEYNDFNCKRIGVLSHQTQGVHDLICDASDVYRWDGERYQLDPNNFRAQFKAN